MTHPLEYKKIICKDKKAYECYKIDAYMRMQHIISYELWLKHKKCDAMILNTLKENNTKNNS